MGRGGSRTAPTSFIDIGAGDLLPEAHRQFNWKVVAAVLAGMGFMLIPTILVPGA